MKKFLEDLEKELRKNNVSEEEIKEILSDHEEMIEEAIKEGLSEEELETKFGDPIKVAEELSDERNNDDSEEEEDEDEEEDEEDSDNEDRWVFKAENGFDIEITLISEDININTTNKSQIIVEFSGTADVKDFKVEYKDNKLVIDREKRSFGIFNFGRNGSATFDIYLPVNLKASYTNIKTVSGDISISKLVTEDINVKTTSGDTEISLVVTDDLKLESVSGDFSIRDVKANDGFVSVVSGDVDAKNLVVKENIHFNTVSGDARLVDSECNDMDFRSVSGDLQGIEFYPNSVALKSVSGDISIKNKSGKEIAVRNQKTLSGDIRINSK